MSLVWTWDIALGKYRMEPPKNCSTKFLQSCILEWCKDLPLCSAVYWFKLSYQGVGEEISRLRDPPFYCRAGLHAGEESHFYQKSFGCYDRQHRIHGGCCFCSGCSCNSKKKLLRSLPRHGIQKTWKNGVKNVRRNFLNNNSLNWRLNQQLLAGRKTYSFECVPIFEGASSENIAN